jgi:hypothetical protein
MNEFTDAAPSPIQNSVFCAWTATQNDIIADPTISTETALFISILVNETSQLDKNLTGRKPLL